MRILVLVLMVLSVGCGSCGSNTHAKPQPAPDPIWCVEAERNLLKLECKKEDGTLLAAPNADGVPWYQICQDVQNAGVALEARCLALIVDCANVETECNFSSDW